MIVLRSKETGRVLPRNPRLSFHEKCLPHPATGCWTWLAALNSSGYGEFWDGTRSWRAHRFAYTVYRGDIPEDLEIDHLCRNRVCVNPYHLELVTSKVNSERGRGAWEHCARGHEITGLSSAGKRFCRECQKERSRAFEASGRRVRKPRRIAVGLKCG